MKKFISMLIAIVMTVSLFPNIAFAAAPNVSAEFSTANVSVGETFTIQIHSAEKTVYMDDTKLRFGNGEINFKNKFEVVYIADNDGYVQDQSCYLHYLPYKIQYRENPWRFRTLNISEQADNFTWYMLGDGTAETYYETNIATICLRALEAGEYTFYLEEYTDYTMASDDTGYNGIAGTYTVNVSPSINMSAISLKVGEMKKLSAGTGLDKKHITWSSSNFNIAKVDANGNVTGKSPGTATITAKSNNGKSASCVVTVQEKYVINFENFKYKFSNSLLDFGYQYHIEEVVKDNEVKHIRVCDYIIPKERYEQAGIKNYTTETWGGSCFGMSASSILFYENILQEESYKKNVHFPSDFDNPDAGDKAFLLDKWEVKLRHMIELFSVAQRREDFSYRDLSVQGIISELNTGNPVALGMYGVAREDSGEGGHEVVIYDYNVNNGIYTFYIYDCSGFVSELIYNNNDGSYDFTYTNNDYIWTPTDYNTFSDFNMLYNRIKTENSNNAVSLFSQVQKEKYTKIVCPVGNMTITNSAGQVSVIADGELTGEIENARLVPGSYLAEEPTYTIILPTDTYTIAGSGDEVVTTAFADDYMSAEVVAKSSTPITISSNLKSITVANSQESEYSIKYNTYDNLFDEMTLSGTASGEVKSELTDSEIKLSGAGSLTATATVSDTSVYASADTLNDEVTVKCEADGNGATIQILGADAELTEKAALPERQAVAAPTYDLESGEYTDAQLLTFTKDDETIIYYTTDGSIPSADNGIIYSLPIDINKSMTINAVATKYGYTDSGIITLSYTLPEVDMPVSDIDSGEYDEVMVFELTSNNENDEIYYTLDGSNPLENGILYTSPVTISEDTYLQAYTARNGLISDICEYEYTITPKSPFHISNSLVNQDNEIITAEALKTLSKVKITVSKLHDGEQKGTFILAFYDISGNLLYTKAQKSTITQDVGESEIDIDADVSKAYTIKAFIWNDSSDMNPLSAVHTEYIAG